MKPIILIILFVVALNAKANIHKNTMDQDSINSSIAKPPSNKYFAIGSGGSYGGIGLKLGRFNIVNEHYQATYIIGGLGGYEKDGTYQLGVLASVGRKFYFPDVLFVDTRLGVQEYSYHGSKLLPVVGVKCIAGIEMRSNRLGISLGLGISQNLLFDQTTRPAIEIGFIFGNWEMPKK